MFFNVLKAKDLVGFDNGNFEKNVLMADNDSTLAVIALKKGEIIDTHTSICDAAVYVLEGEIELHFDAEKFEVDKGQILMFKKDKEHKVVANKDSKFFLIKKKRQKKVELNLKCIKNRKTILRYTMVRLPGLVVVNYA